MLNNRVEFCKKDFQMYKDFQKNIDICNQRVAELKNKYISVESIQGNKKGTQYASLIEKMQQDMYTRSKEALEVAIIDNLQNMFIISRTIDLCVDVIDSNVHTAICLTVLDGDTQECAARAMKYSRPQITKFVNSFFNNPKCQEMDKLAIKQSENDFSDFIE